MKEIIKQVTYTYNFLNPTAKDNPDWSYIPGFRGADQSPIMF